MYNKKFKKYGQYGYNNNSYSSRRTYEPDYYEPSSQPNYQSSQSPNYTNQRSASPQPSDENQYPPHYQQTYQQHGHNGQTPSNGVYNQAPNYQQNQGYTGQTIPHPRQSPVPSTASAPSHQPASMPFQSQPYPDHIESEHPAKKQKTETEPYHTKPLKIAPIPDRGDGTPLLRRDIHYEFLHILFNDGTRAFSDPYPNSETLIYGESKTPGHKLTFSELYMKSLAHSNQISRNMRARLASPRDICVPPSIVYFLFNIGRLLNQTFIPSMTNKNFHSIPCLEVNYNPPTDLEPNYHVEGRNQLVHDIPTINSLLRGNIARTKEPKQFSALNKITKRPRTTVINLLLMFKEHQNDINNLFFNKCDYKYADIFMNHKFNPLKRAQLFLWLVFAYLETDVSVQAQNINPFGQLPPVLVKTNRDYDIEQPQEIEFAEYSKRIRNECKNGIYKTGSANQQQPGAVSTAQATQVQTAQIISKFNENEGKCFTRKDIQYEFLMFLFENDVRAFTDPFGDNGIKLHTELSTKRNKLTFAELYIKSLANSTACPRSLRKKLTGTKDEFLAPVCICFLVHTGLIDVQTTFDTHGSITRIFRSIPCLQLSHKSEERDANGNPFMVTETASLNSVLKSASKDDKASSLKSLNYMKKNPRTTVGNVLFLFRKYEDEVNKQFFNDSKYKFSDILNNHGLNPQKRADLFLYLVFFYLETAPNTENPFIFQIMDFAEYDSTSYDIDTEEEKNHAQKLYQQRSEFKLGQGIAMNELQHMNIDYQGAGKDKNVGNKESSPDDIKGTAQNFLAGILSELQSSNSNGTEGATESEKNIENGEVQVRITSESSTSTVNNNDQRDSLGKQQDQTDVESQPSQKPQNLQPRKKESQSKAEKVELLESIKMDTDSPHQIYIKLPELIDDKVSVNDALNHISSTLSNHYCVYFEDD
ncbi:Ino eighty subunit 1 [Wickerhamomyces ciferrii]|uniref:Ino eighty subunit 1 n=1 Tax=Wickerhamomyces ciferrii (strain ATCC 14091 / BCRC 22168 / CBS 111 / JCM 3599 / NBRC 0793 / NRRL Y-1031 F-60-10) TaxID=1206466 RepID=K0K860_WICCF|nr:Ino eighty subunit 1 [Wickerhamomyces ciferrii]CCH41010.1 Ino eighty subunit 1 [Wickerhamomyces ciferrii]